jgi:hypothetical protein
MGFGQAMQPSYAAKSSGDDSSHSIIELFSLLLLLHITSSSNPTKPSAVPTNPPSSSPPSNNPWAIRTIANNPNPISIPCHRVVKSNGEIGGFAYGKQRKREILEKEGIKFQNRIVENFEEQRLSF